ncbi:MAG: T9SS type A sorting domain-containing protein [Candidatus Kapaibacterium sp.]
MKNLILILIFNSLLTLSIRAQFKVAQSNPNNYSFNSKENAHQLTDGSNRMQATAIWNNSAVPGFEKIDLNYNFLVEAEYYLGYKDKEGADGIAFVLQSDGDDKLGSLGVGMGFAANYYDHNKKVSPSLGIELDTWFNNAASPPVVDTNPEDHFAYVVNGDLLDRVGLDINVKENLNGRPLNIEDSTFHCVKFFWNSTTKELSSYLDGQLRKTEVFNGIKTSTLTSIIQTDLVYWGFTTGTATRDNIHMVRFDEITRDNEACFVEIYKESAYDVTNPNCGYEQIEVCKNNPESKINLSLTTTQLPIDKIEWVSKNSTTIITPLNPQKDKVNLQMNQNDVIVVTVYYSNGCIAYDEFAVFTKDIEIINELDTIRLCQSDNVKIDFDLKIYGKIVDNSSDVKWNWTNREYIVNQGELTDKEQIYLNDSKSDTITFVVTAEVTDDLKNKCLDMKTVTVIVENYYFKEKITYSPCADTAYIEFEVYEDAGFTIPLSKEKIKKMSWVSPKSNNDYINGIIPDGMEATVVTEGKYDLNFELKNGCFISKSVFADFSKDNLDLLPRVIELCKKDTISVESEVEAKTYTWSTGETTRGIKIWEAGKYTLEIETSAGCKFYDTLLVVMLPDIEFNIVGDTVICKNGDFVTLKTDKSYDKYQWSTGSTATNIKINTPGVYWLKVTNKNGCIAYDSINVVSFDSLFVRIVGKGGCNMDSVLLGYETNSKDFTIKWSNGSTTDSIWVNKSGNYFVELKDNTSGCMRKYYMNVELTKGFYPELIGDMNLCEGDETELEVIGCLDCKYEWSEGSTDSKSKFDKQTKGYVIVSKSSICIDTLYYDIKLDALPNPEIQGNLKVCYPDSTLLFIEGNYKSILWSNGQSSNNIYAKESGDYYVTVETELGCLGYDTVIVEAIDIKQELEYKDTIDFGKVYLDNKVELKVELNSKFYKPIYLSSNFNGNINRFDFLNNKLLEFSLKPDKIGEYRNKIEFIVEQPCLDTFFIYIVGRVYTKVTLELPKVISYPGDQAYLPIKLRSKLNIDDKYNFDLNYDSEVIYLDGTANPMNFTKEWSLNGSEQMIENPSGTILLTDLSERPLTVDSLFWENKYIESDVINGWIRLDTICTHEFRVIEVNYDVVNTFYDLGKDRLIIQKNGSANASGIEVSITNLSGASVLTKSTTITDTKELDLSGLAAGVYFVKIEFNGLSNLYKFIKMH